MICDPAAPPIILTIDVIFYYVHLWNVFLMARLCLGCLKEEATRRTTPRQPRPRAGRSLEASPCQLSYAQSSASAMLVSKFSLISMV